MTSSDEDEDLKRAIALSLGQDDPITADATDPTSMLSQRDGEDKSTVPSHSAADSTTQSSSIIGSSGPPRGIAGLDRKEMEKQRLARLEARRDTTQKRALPISPPPINRGQSPSKRIKTAAPTQPLVSSKGSGKGCCYTKGTIKKTWAWKRPRENDVKLEEILQKDDLKLGLFSSFIWDGEWLLRKLDTRRTNIIMAMQAKDEATKREQREMVEGIPNIKLAFPPMDGQVNCMHSKLMLLAFPTHLRVAIPSANLMSYDWGETGVMENSVFLIDLPRLPESTNQTIEQLPSFGAELSHFLDASHVDGVSSQLLKFDFSETKDIAFVHTIGGAHFSPELDRTGLPGLATAIRSLGLESTVHLELDIIAASIGSLNFDFLSDVYTSALGSKSKRLKGPQKPSGAQKTSASNFFKPRGESSTPASQKSDFSFASDSFDGSQKHLSTHIRIHFPTAETVRSSTGGEDSAGTICLQSKWWDAPTFPKSLMRDHISTRDGLLSHNKIILGRGLQRTESGALKPIAWVYHGSANLSESAWGKVVQDRARKEPKLNCRNWECGVLIKVPVPETAAKRVDGKEVEAEPVLPGFEVFKGVIDIPCHVPGQGYGSKRPWFFMGDHRS